MECRTFLGFYATDYFGYFEFKFSLELQKMADQKLGQSFELIAQKFNQFYLIFPQIPQQSY